MPGARGGGRVELTTVVGASSCLEIGISKSVSSDLLLNHRLAKIAVTVVTARQITPLITPITGPTILDESLG